MQTVLLIICIISFFVSLKKNTGSSPITVFFGIWMVIIGFYSLKLGGIFDISEKTEFIIISGVIAWGLGAIFVPSHFWSYTINGNKIKLISDDLMTTDYKYYFAFAVMTIIMGSAAFNGLLAVLGGSSLHDIRYLLRNEIISSNNGNMMMLYLYVGTPISYLLMHYNMVRVFNNVKFRRAMVELVFIVSLSLLSIGGRFILLYIGFDFLLVMLLKKRTLKSDVEQKKKANKKKSNKLIIMAIILLIVGFVYMTINGGSNVFNTIYFYTCGCVPFLDNKIMEFNSIRLYTYGFTSLNGFIRPIFTLLRSIGLIGELPLLVQLSEKYLSSVETAVAISSNGYFNGFVSMFYSMYVDFGIIGVIIISFIWGRICNSVYRKMIYNRNDRTLLIYFMLMQAVLVSMLRFAFVDYQYALSFIYLFLIFGKTKQWKEKDIRYENV